MSRRELGHRLDRLYQEAGKEVYHLLSTDPLGLSGSGVLKSRDCPGFRILGRVRSWKLEVLVASEAARAPKYLGSGPICSSYILTT